MIPVLAALAQGPLPSPAEAYTPYPEALERALASARQKPGTVLVETIGETRLGEPIVAFHVAEPLVPVERAVLVFAGIHALEWISTETAFALLDDLIAVPPRGIRVTVIPVLNVDGRARAEADIRLGDDVFRRGNIAGVDLNRDFAVNAEARSLWRHLLPGYHSSSRRPLSQPETRALDRLAARERYDRAASLHSFGGYLYHPWAGRWARPEDHREYLELGRQMEEAMGPHAYRTRQLSRWGFFFRAQGTEIDHLYGRYGTLAWLIELTRSGIDLRHPLRSLRTSFCWYNPTDPRPHVERGLSALRALIGAPGG